MTDLFKTPETPVDEPESFLSELVGEGKKYSDHESLAKGAYHKDLHIQRLEQENETMRQDLQKRLTIEEFLEQSRQVEAQGNERDTPRQDTNQFDTDKFKTELLSEVNNLFNQQKKVSQAQQNVQMIRSKLEDTWGKNIEAKLNQKAQELNLSKEFLSGLAETNPQGFLSIVLGPQAQARDHQSPPKNSIRVDGSNHSGERTQSYYSNLRKTNPKLYYTKEVQLQEYKDAMRLRDAFFDK